MVWILFFFFNYAVGFSTIDSLLTRSTQLKDTARINTLVKIAVYYMNAGQMQQSEKFLQMAVKENSVIQNKNTQLYISLKQILLSYKKSNFQAAYDSGTQTLSLAVELKNTNAIGECKLYMGMCKGRLGDFKGALELYHQVQPLFDAEKNIPMQMKLYSNIAGVYFDQLDYKTAIEFFKKTLEMAIKKKDLKVIGQTYNNIGSSLSNLKEDKEAKQYYLKAVEINKQSGNTHNLGYNYMNLASCELIESNTIKAKEYNAEALKIFTDFNDPYSIVSCLSVDGDILIKEKKYNAAVKLFEGCVTMGEKTGSPLLMERTYRQMSNAYELAGDSKRSLIYLKKYIETKDSIINEEIRDEITKKQLYYEFDKKHLADSLEAESKQLYLKQEVTNNQRSAALQRNISIISLLSLCSVGVLAFYIYRGSKRNKIASKIIAGQKQMVEVKNKEIVDSINYAKRIQYALLAQDEILTANLASYFILFKPKDIVSGDFYWAATVVNQQQEELFFLVCCDSTGHGVPGAFMSLLNIGFLNEAIKERNIHEPNQIFNFVRKRLVESISSDGQQDGFDGVILCINKSRQLITYAAANSNPLLISNGKASHLHSDKMPVGKDEKEMDFSLNTLNYKTGDSLYLYTDGYPDQFGGPKGKKFKYKQLEELIVSYVNKPMAFQKENLKTTLENWQGNLEQVDDVCIIGISI